MKLILIAVCICLFVSCKEHRLTETERVVIEWTGKTIRFDSLQNTEATSFFRDTLKPYKILLYTDSTGCTKCKLQTQLPVWKAYIKKMNATVNFLLCFQIKDNEKELLLSLLKNERFDFPFYIDENDALNKVNRFPVNPAHQCFLLDRNNCVLTLGNPAENPKIW
jgi:hypothetical protein